MGTSLVCKESVCGKERKGSLDDLGSFGRWRGGQEQTGGRLPLGLGGPEPCGEPGEAVGQKKNLFGALEGFAAEKGGPGA